MKAYLHKKAEKYLKRLNETDRDCIKDAIKKIEKEPPEGDIQPMTGQDGFRTRIRDFRILWCIEEDYIKVTHIDPRGQVYKKRIRGIKDDSSRFKKRVTLHY